MRRIATGVAILVAPAMLAGCSGSSAAPSAHQPTTHATTATHWWSSTDYCGILRQTVRAGHSILAGARANDPEVLAATKTFVADLTAAAPATVRGHWRILGSALTELVESRGVLSAVSGVNNRQVSAAATAVAADARTRCQLDVSS